MSSGRSARLPPTPSAAANTAANKPRGVHNALPEPNSNNVLPPSAYAHMKSNNSNSNNGIGGIGMGGGGSGGTGLGGLSMLGGMNMAGYTNFCAGMGMNNSAGVGGVGLIGVGANVGGVGVGGGGGGGVGSITTIDAATEGIPSETIDALGPELAVATSQVLENLSEAERKMIIEVLNRDENVRQRDATRIIICYYVMLTSAVVQVLRIRHGVRV
ncbi:glycine, alanine and asparagine-rich protein-like [Bactrocera neohumeralis]|uniref:glycine, alanine and asparagine-rich protein-like n=1 Tax=Bactrocera neohumeralis TaxID=98809 RepID=UPI0021658B2A|nr:glycine, alanine and asparagine-rich protein-like [Bactrocera neohumeralis]